MKLTLIKPKVGHSEDGAFREKAVLEPLALATLAALTPPDVDVVMYDDRLEPIPYDQPTDLVAISAHSLTAKRAYEISREFRSRGVPVVLGGYHPSQVPEEARHFADSVYIGDAEAQWGQVIADARAGRLATVYRASFGPPSVGLIPRRDIFAGKAYLPITPVQFSRGCPFECNFCTIGSLYHGRRHFRPVDDVIADIESQNRKVLLFVDDNIAMNPSAAKALFRALIPLKVRWMSQASVTMTRDLELMDLMQRSGCIGNLVGFESVNPLSLADMNKRANLAHFDRYEEEIRVIRDHGLLVWAAFTLGHEHDTPATIEETLAFTQRWKFPIADFNVLLPYPNTPLYDRLAREGRLLYDGRWWLHPDYRYGCAAFRPNLMTPDELAHGCWQARRRFYRAGSIVRRALDPKTHLRSPHHLWFFILTNVVHAHDSLKKQDIYLGEERWAYDECERTTC